jgi:hypothetical protein
VPSPRPFLAAAFAAVLASIPTSPSVAAPWSPPASVGPPDTELHTLVTGTSGSTIAAGYGAEGDDLQPIGPTGVPGRLRATRTGRGVGVYGDRAVILHRSDDFRRVTVSFGDLGARSLGRERTLHRGRPVDPTLAVGPRGHVLVALGVDGPRAGDDFAGERVRLTWSAARATRRWRTRTLPGRTEVLAVGVDRAGTAVLLLQRPTPAGYGYRVVARTLALGSGRLGPERTLDRTTRDDLTGTVAINDGGDAVLAWGAQDGGEQADRPFVVRAAVRRRGSTRFGRGQTLDAGGAAERPGPGPVAAVDDAGNALVGWTQALGGERSVPRAATATAGRRFGRRRNLLATGYVGDAVSWRDTAVLSVAGYAPRGSAPVGGVVTRRAAGALGAVEPLPTTGPEDVDAALLTAGPTGLRAVWDGSGPDGPALRFSLRALD